MGQTYSVPLICLLSHSYSSTIEIQNSGFESDVVGHDNTLLYGTNLLQPWERCGPNGKMMNRSVGVMNPTGGTSFNDPIYGDSAPEGTQNGYIHNDARRAEYGINQTLTGNTVAAGTTYTLSAWIGNPTNNIWSTFSTEPSVSYNMTGYAGYGVQLLADNNVLVEDNNQLSIEEGHWKQSVISITTSPGDPHIGQTLGIRIRHTRGLSPILCFDGIRLEATTMAPSLSPTMQPTAEPTVEPTQSTSNPTESPSRNPSESPSESPTNSSESPSETPSESPTTEPTGDPSTAPTKTPSAMPTVSTSDDGDDVDSDASYITFAANMIIGICLSLAMV